MSEKIVDRKPIGSNAVIIDNSIIIAPCIFSVMTEPSEIDRLVHAKLSESMDVVRPMVIKLDSIRSISAHPVREGYCMVALFLGGTAIHFASVGCDFDILSALWVDRELSFAAYPFGIDLGEDVA